MTDFQKSLTRFMYITLFFAIVLAAWVLVRPSIGRASGLSANAIGSKRGVTATGSCVVRTKPDLVEVSLGVTNSAMSAKVAYSGAKSRIAKVISVLKAGGVAGKDIQTQSLSLAPNWDYDRKILTWKAQEELYVRVRKIADVADLVDKAVTAGANKVNSLNYTTENLNELRSKGRARAASIAREKAKQLASSLGGKLGRLISVDEGYPGDDGYYWGPNASARCSAQANELVAARPAVAERSEITLQPGEVTVNVVVTATYEVE